ncbi:M48 family metalloprotease [Halorubellus sp. JP-L1]|uniref:M48 family metallopeptidase n=1 Tax=Halorubellus sp. JP-L1 TaxID=2715753 RepID=UPI00140C6023|nr:M48 family metalloprotease [Halorubellus sp. JP-L1]NHN43088.1 M48 family metalloprotease [Halorubellus sp. JP-L1]
MERDRPLVRRILLTLALILAIDAVVVGVFALLAYPWLSVVHDPIAAIVGSQAALLARWLVVFVPVLVLFVWAQLRFTKRELLADVPATDATRETHPDLHARFARLCKQADVQPPNLGVVDSSVPNSFAVGGVTDATVVVSEGLFDALSDDELDAVLAHELAHVKNRDATVMTLASFLPALVSDDRRVVNGDGAHLFVWIALTFVLYVLSSAFVPGALFSMTSVLGFVALVAISVLGGGILLGVLTAPVVLLSRRLSESREFVADRAGAVLVGDPSALVTALEKLSDRGLGRPETDARAHYRGVDGLCFLPYGLDETGDEAANDDAFTVETRSHPPTHERVANLRALADEL